MTLQVIVFQLDKQDYAVPILEVREVVKISQITPVPNAPEFVSGVINLRGKVVPIVDMEKWFGLEQRVDKSAFQHIVIIDGPNDSEYGFLVDKLDNVMKVEETEVKPAPKIVEDKISGEYLRGVIILNENVVGSEKIILVLDLAKALTKLGLERLAEVGQN